MLPRDRARSSPISRLRQLWLRGTEPSSRLVDLGERRSARLLASLLLALVPLGLLSALAQLLMVPDFRPTLFPTIGGLVVLAAAYVACRTLDYRIAGVTASLVPVVAAGSVGLSNPGDPVWFAFMNMGTVLASAFLPARHVGAIGAVTVGATAVVLLAGGERISGGTWAAILSFNVMLTTLVVLVSRHRSAVEQIRQGEIRERQALYRTLFEHAPVGIGVTDDDGRLVAFNDAMPRLGGYTRQDLEERTSAASYYVDPGDRASLHEQMQRDGTVRGAEVRLLAKDGTPYEVSLSLVPITFDRRRCVMAIAENVSERKRAEAERGDLAEIIERSLNEIYLFDPGTLRFEYANEGARRNVGYAMEHLRSLTPMALQPEFDEASFRALIDPLLRGTTQLLVFETVHRRADATLYPVEVRLQLASRSGHRALLAVVLDVTARRQAEREREQLSERLVTQEQRFRALIEHSSDVIALVGGDGRLQHLNPAFESILGHPARAWLGRNLLDLVWPQDRPAAEATFARGLATPGEVIDWEFRILHADGSFRWMEGTGTNYLDDPATRGVVVNCRDVTSRRQAEETVRRNEQRLRLALDLASLAVFEMDAELRYLWMYNPQLGHSPEQVVGRTDVELLGEDGLDVMAIKRRVMETGERAREEVRVRGKGTEFTFDLTVEPLRSESGAIVGIRGASLDISEARALRAQFLQAQKMDSVGRLAGGMAHDFNNLLTVITGTAALSAAQLRDNDPLRRDLEEIRRAGERGAALIRQLLAFSRKQVLQPDMVNLNAIVGDVTSMLRRLIGDHIELVVVPAQDLGEVRVDQGQIEQVIVNLAVNARDAMPDGGVLTLETRNAEVDEAHARLLSGPSGPVVMLAVTDTGLGMDAATRERVFEPFFTTKAVGAGTGLGLSTVYGIVKQSGGAISVASEPGKGCTFRIYLPRVGEAARADRPPRGEFRPERGAGTILLVEDEDAILRLAERALVTAGYQVLVAADAYRALQLLREHEGPIDLVITDVVMPGMSGLQLAERLPADRPGIQVLFTSGFAPGAGSEPRETSHLLSKPYTMAELVQRARARLESRLGHPH